MQIHAAMIVGKEALNVDITTANKQLEYTREGRREKEYEFDQVTNHTPFSVDKLVRLKDHDALLINQFLLSDERFQIKHKWRSKLLHSVSELMFCLDSLYTRESSIERYEDFIWEQNDKGTKLLCIRRLVVHKLGGKDKTIAEMYHCVDQLVKMEFTKVEQLVKMDKTIAEM